MKRSGTWLTFLCGGHADKREHQNTNVAKFHGLLKKHLHEQIVYYQVSLDFASVFC